MSVESRASVAWPNLLGAALLLVALGAGGTYVGLRSVGRSGSATGEPATAAPAVTSAPAIPAALPGSPIRPRQLRPPPAT